MSRDLIPTSDSRSPVLQKVRWIAPPALVGTGVACLFLLHSIVLGILLFGSGCVWLALSVLKALPSPSPTQALSPEEMARKQLKRKLLRLQGVDGCESSAERALEQLSQAEERYRTFEQLLSSKLSSTELTFSRYHSAAERVFFSILDKITEISELLSSIETIRPSEVREKLQQIKSRSSSASPSSAQSSPEEKPLQERLSVVETQQKRASELLTSNEEALTEMDHANVALTEMKTQPGLASVDLGTALKQLEELAQRAKQYSR